MRKIYKVAAISGSLKKFSTSKGLIKTCLQLNNSQLNIETIDNTQFPLFNEDISFQSLPLSSKISLEKIKLCDAVLVSHPNHNNLVSAYLKNTYDWLSRGKQTSAIYKKPMAQMITTYDPVTDAIGQHFQQITKYCNVTLMKTPKIQIKTTQPNIFDEQGNLISNIHQKQIEQFLKAFVIFINKHY